MRASFGGLCSLASKECLHGQELLDEASGEASSQIPKTLIEQEGLRDRAVDTGLGQEIGYQCGVIT